MVQGIFAGITWAIETLLVGLILNMTPFIENGQAIVVGSTLLQAVHLHGGKNGLLLL